MAQFHWKALLYHCNWRYNSDNSMNHSYINHLWQCPQSLVGKKDIMPCTNIILFVCTSYPVWHSQPSITTITHSRSKARLQTGCGCSCQTLRSMLQVIIYSVYINHLQQQSWSLARMISYPVFNLALNPPCIVYIAMAHRDRLHQTGWLVPTKQLIQCKV